MRIRLARVAEPERRAQMAHRWKTIGVLVLVSAVLPAAVAEARKGAPPGDPPVYVTIDVVEGDMAAGAGIATTCPTGSLQMIRDRGAHTAGGLERWSERL